MKPAYEITFSEIAFGHLEAIKHSDRNVILDAIKDHLSHTPEDETRNRKLLQENPLADWELRVGQYRVFYEVNAAHCLVRVVAVGVKERSKLIIGGQEVVL